MKTVKLPGEVYAIEGHPDLRIMRFDFWRPSAGRMERIYTAHRKVGDVVTELAEAYTLRECKVRLARVLEKEGFTF